MRLGELLLAEKLVSKEGLEEALESQVVHGGRLGTNLVELGLLSETDLAKALGKQHNCAFASGLMTPDPKAFATLDIDFQDDKDVLPMRMDQTRISVACINPHDLQTMDAIGFRTGRRVVPVVIPEFRMNQLLRKYCKAFRNIRAIDMESVRPSRTLAAKNPQKEAAADLMSEDEFQTLYAKALSGEAEGEEVTASSAVPLAGPEPEAEVLEGVLVEESGNYPIVPPPEAVPRAPGAAQASAQSAMPTSAPRTAQSIPAAPAARPTAPLATPAGRPTAPPAANVPPAASVPPGVSRPPAVNVPVAAPPAPAMAAMPSPAAQPRPATMAPAALVGAPSAATSAPPVASASPGVAAPRAAQPMARAPEAEAPPPSPLTFAEAQAALAKVDDREDVAKNVLRFALGKWKRALLLNVQGPLVTGWHGYGAGVRDKAVRRIAVALRGQSSFKLVCDTRSHFIGPVKRDAGTAVFYKMLGGDYPTTAVMLPLLVRGKVVHILYVDNGPGQLTPPDIGELLILGQSVARSYEAMIRRRKTA